MRSPGSRRRTCATTGAGAAGTARMSTTYRSNTSSTSPSRSGRKPTRSRLEAANVRHQHEMDVWRTTKLAPGTILMPGVISHATNIVEHPELIARRLVDWAGIVGRENVVG